MPLVSDEFDGAELGAHWTEYDPSGVGTLAVAGGLLEIAVDGSGAGHYFWSDNRSGVVALQTPGGLLGDLELEAAVEFPKLVSGVQHGLIVFDDPVTPAQYVWVEIVGNQFGTRMSHGHAVFGDAGVEWFSGVPTGDANFLRLKRAGDVWSAEYSADAESWTQLTGGVAQFDATSAGLFASNSLVGSSDDPQFGYFRDNLASAPGGTPPLPRTGLRRLGLGFGL